MTKTEQVKDKVNDEENVDYLLQRAERFVNATPVSTDEIRYRKGRTMMTKPSPNRRSLFSYIKK